MNVYQNKNVAKAKQSNMAASLYDDGIDERQHQAMEIKMDDQDGDRILTDWPP